jgi:hypothetical protein
MPQIWDGAPRGFRTGSVKGRLRDCVQSLQVPMRFLFFRATCHMLLQP